MKRVITHFSHDSRTGTVCDDDFSTQSALAICREMGYNRIGDQSYWVPGSNDGAAYDIKLDDVSCENGSFESCTFSTHHVNLIFLSIILLKYGKSQKGLNWLKYRYCYSLSYFFIYTRFWWPINTTVHFRTASTVKMFICRAVIVTRTRYLRLLTRILPRLRIWAQVCVHTVKLFFGHKSPALCTTGTTGILHCEYIEDMDDFNYYLINSHGEENTEHRISKYTPNIDIL